MFFDNSFINFVFTILFLGGKKQEQKYV